MPGIARMYKCRVAAVRRFLPECKLHAQYVQRRLRITLARPRRKCESLKRTSSFGLSLLSCSINSFLEYPSSWILSGDAMMLGYVMTGTPRMWPGSDGGLGAAVWGLGLEGGG